MNIRKITPADRAVYLQLSDEFYRSEAVLHPVPAEYFERSFEELMRSEDYLLCYLLEWEGETAGYALLAKTWSVEAGGAVVWLEELYLRPAFRGKGLGSGFLAYMTREIPAARYRLEVEPDNHRAKALYGRYGFEVLPYEQLKCGN